MGANAGNLVEMWSDINLSLSVVLSQLILAKVAFRDVIFSVYFRRYAVEGESTFISAINPKGAFGQYQGRRVVE